MKLVKISPKSLMLSPKRLFRGKKRASGESPSKSDPPSFGSGTTSSSGSGTTSSSSSASDLKAGIGAATPQSVLPGTSGELSEFSAAADLAEALRLVDRGNDGVVSREALESLLSRLGSGADAAAMLSEIGFGGGAGEISVEALVSRVGGPAAPAEDSEMREAFEFFDADRDGKISAEELLSFYATIGDERCTLEDCRSMIAGVDRVGDGFVCFEDFSRMMDLQGL